MGGLGGGDGGKSFSGVWFDPEEEFEFVGDEKFDNEEEPVPLDPSCVEWEEEQEGKGRIGGGGGEGGGGGGGGGGDDTSEINFEGVEELISDVSLRLPAGAFESRGGGGGGGINLEGVEEFISDVLLRVLHAEAFESRGSDECELHKEWKDSSSDELVSSVITTSSKLQPTCSCSTDSNVSFTLTISPS